MIGHVMSLSGKEFAELDKGRQEIDLAVLHPHDGAIYFWS
jgi:hypothetical protein